MRHTEWNISRDDLPTAADLKAEPRLMDLENNAVFRLLIKLRRPANLYSSMITLTVVAVVFTLFLGVIGRAGDFILLSFYLLLRLQNTVSACQEEMPGTGFLPISLAAYYRDLAASPITTEVFMFGAWGHILQLRLMRNLHIEAVYIILLSAAGIFFSNYESKWILHLIIAIETYSLVYLRFGPWRHLGLMLRGMRRMRYQLGAVLNASWDRLIFLIIAVFVTYLARIIWDQLYWAPFLNSSS